MQWLKYDGSNGIDDIFDPVKNKSKKHKGDDTLVPSKTKMDKNRYEDFPVWWVRFHGLWQERPWRRI